MTAIDRRRAVQLALLAAFLPSSFTDAFAASGRTQALFGAHRRAADRGRPLLVFVVPHRDLWYEHGQALGALLNHGGDAALGALALCEVVCGTAPDLATLLGEAVADDTWMVLLETDRVPAIVRFGGGPGDGALAGLRRFGESDAIDRDVDARIRTLRETLLDLVLPDRSTLARYVAQAERVDPAGVGLVQAHLTDPTPEVAARAPAALALAAVDGEADQVEAMIVLAAVARANWIDEVVPGSRWARSHGCGMRVEGVEDHVATGCGMGYVPEKARRMLYFWEES